MTAHRETQTDRPPADTLMDRRSSADITSDDAGVLRERARTLAMPLEQAQPQATLEVLEFRVGQERYALEILHVREVCRCRSLTPLPGLPPFVRGVVNVRGRIVAVLDLRMLLELPNQGTTDAHQVIVIEGHDMEVGLLADAAVGIRGIPANSLHAATPVLAGGRAEYIKGITPDHLVVLEVTRILADPRVIVDHDVEH